MKPKKIAQIGPYPPPDTGWSVRIKQLRQALEAQGHECVVLNTGATRTIKSPDYIDVQNGFDYILKLAMLGLKGYRFHIHGNAQAVKGPILCLLAHIIAWLTLKPACMTFHGGYTQLYFPRKNAGKMHLVLFLNFLLSKKIICNDEEIKNRIHAFGPWISLNKIFPIQAFSTQYLDYEQVDLPESIADYLRDKSHVVSSYIAIRNGFYLETLVECIKSCPDHIGFVLTGCGKLEDAELEQVQGQLEQLEAKGRAICVPSLSHDEFMTLLQRSDIYLRTPDSDGISSSVLEALASGTVVVASENGRRPKSVVTYTADDAQEMKTTIDNVLAGLDDYVAALEKPQLVDTVSEEVNVLVK